VMWLRWRDREEKSLKQINLLVAVPQENEVKIDAMEQIISSFASIYKTAKPKFVQAWISQPSASLEIVGTDEDIRFYISIQQKYQDLIEKQIYSVYAGADIKVTEEANIYTQDGAIEYAWMTLKKASHYPLKTYKEIPTDPLAAITSALSKLEKGESVSIQLVVSPTDGSWAKLGKSFISNTKKSESNPEKAAYKVEARQLEAMEQKCSKGGLETAIRIVAVEPNREIAKTNIANIKACFGQFESPWNKLSGKKIRLTSMFMEDFIYKYPVMLWLKNKTILSAEELAPIFHLPNK